MCVFSKQKCKVFLPSGGEKKLKNESFCTVFVTVLFVPRPLCFCTFFISFTVIFFPCFQSIGHLNHTNNELWRICFQGIRSEVLIYCSCRELSGLKQANFHLFATFQAVSYPHPLYMCSFTPQICAGLKEVKNPCNIGKNPPIPWKEHCLNPLPIES